MSTDDWVRVGLLGFVVLAIAGSALIRARGNFMRVAQQAAIWGLIILGTIAIIGLFPQIRQSVLPRQVEATAGSIEIPMGEDGHYHAVLRANGTPVLFTVDTGASDVVLSLADAKRIGIEAEKLVWVGSARTANGSVRLAPVVLEELSLEGFQTFKTRASVNEGEMDQSLLGMSFLSRFKKIEISAGKLVLQY